MKRAVLHYIDLIRPGGGPMGYLYNLKLSLEKAPSETPIYIYASKVSHARSGTANEKLDFFAKVGKFVPTFLMVLVHYLYYLLKMHSPLNKKDASVLKKHEAVVIHNIILLSKYLRTKKPNAQKIYCMSHSPTTFSEELCEYVVNFHNSTAFSKIFLKLFSKKELKLYKRIDGIITPCKEAVEGYFHYDISLKKDFQRLNFVEVPSGLPGLVPKKPVEGIQQELGLDKEKLNVCYIGRYHSHKGFDLFNQLAEATSKKSNKVAFCSVGKGSILPDKNHVYDIGWRSDIADVINSMDLIISCNKFTYFDLLALEVMSLGKPIALTEVGGNKFLKKLSPGILTYQASSFGKLIERLTNIKKSELEELGQINKQVFEEEFNEIKFLHRHMSLATQILSSKKDKATVKA